MTRKVRKRICKELLYWNLSDIKSFDFVTEILIKIFMVFVLLLTGR